MGALLLSDLVLGFYDGMLVQYAATALAVADRLAGARRAAHACSRIGGAALASAILFFVVTNFGVWLSSGMYPPTLAGLAACYVAAIPFFQNTLAGDLFFAALLFGGFALAERALPALRERRRSPPDRLATSRRPPVRAPLDPWLLVGNQRRIQGNRT